tara:strand:+ start:445 stop:1020 length:576 start_codon:yes stop_codon:yes gene_type:complete
MKKFLLLSFLIFSSVTNINAETNRVISGNENAKITIIVYESLTCSHCATFHKEIYPLLKKEFIDTGLLKIEFRHFPLDIAALNAAKIVQCKEDQSLEILNSLYSNQQAWIKGNTIENINKNLKKYLNQAGFDVNYEKCLNNKEIEDFVLNDRIQGVKAFKINATPTIIINEKKFEKTLNYKNLKKSLEKLL